MREIKFRAWDNETKEMIYQDEHTCFNIADGFIGIDCDETKDYEYREWSWKGGLTCVLMQYTGFKDKKGREIYEDDIVKTSFGIGRVFMRLGCWFVENQQNLAYFPTSDIEVIGNFYENPELLKEVKDE